MAALLTICAMFAVGAGAIAVHRFSSQTPRPALRRPAVTVMKPLCGDEPFLEEALASICDQAYPTFQIVFGVQDARDPALLVELGVRWAGTRAGASLRVSDLE